MLEYFTPPLIPIRDNLSVYLPQIAVLFIIFIVVVALWCVPPALARKRIQKFKISDDISAADILENERQARSFFVQLVSGIALAASLTIAWFSFHDTNRNISETQKYQAAERYTKAIDLIGNDNNPIMRIGGVYALEQIAKSYTDYSEPAARVLSAFIQQHSSRNRLDGTCVAMGDQSPSDEDIAAKHLDGNGIGRDTQDTIRAIGRILKMYDGASAVNLEGVDLSNTDLCIAYAKNVSFHDVYFANSDLRGSIFDYADMTRANFLDADLREIHLPHAILTSANFRNANMMDAWLEDTKFNKADMCGAILRNVAFKDSNLEDASLNCADLRGADLRDTVGLILAQTQSACIDNKTLMPKGISPKSDNNCIEKCRAPVCASQDGK